MADDERTALAWGGLASLIAYAGAWTWRTATVDMQHFSPSEFGVWWPLMHPDLLAKLERFRERWGAPVTINHPNRGGLGRVGPKHANSKHYVGVTRKQWRYRVRAADITPHGIETADDLRRAYEIAYDVGFTGIGLYPGRAAKWARPGLHVDVRGDRRVGDPAVWARINRADVRRRLGLGPIERPRDAYVARSLALEPAVWGVG